MSLIKLGRKKKHYKNLTKKGGDYKAVMKVIPKVNNKIEQTKIL